MDDLASFAHAPAGLVLRQRRLLSDADVVFTGGPSLHRGVLPLRRDRVHLFRSGVETGHYAASRRLHRPHDRPVAGYVGVIDERLDLTLLGELAAALPDWTIRVVGPVAKIDPAQLPQAGNLEYPGLVAYADLPEVMAGFDVALMPFALNEATRSISPTKTLEYLAAGLPVVSTRVTDVVDDYAEVVHLADDGAGFAAACRAVLEDDLGARDRRAQPLQARQEWDAIAAEMARLIEDPGAGVSQLRTEEPA
nr:glycosyltransferase [Modestobacter versicolor]